MLKLSGKVKIFHMNTQEYFQDLTRTETIYHK